jgi:hypothetical protein
MSMNNSRFKEGKNHRKSSVLHHMVSSHFNDEGNILRAHALDLYLVFASRTHFEQSVEEFVNSPNSTSENSKPANMHAH